MVNHAGGLEGLPFSGLGPPVRKADNLLLSGRRLNRSKAGSHSCCRRCLTALDCLLMAQHGVAFRSHVQSQGIMGFSGGATVALKPGDECREEPAA